MLGIYETKYEFDTLLLPTDTKVFDLKYHNCCVETRNVKRIFMYFIEILVFETPHDFYVLWGRNI